MAGVAIRLGRVARPKGQTKNLGTPLGDFADFLRAKLDTDFRRRSDEDMNDIRARFVKALARAGYKIGEEGVRKWEQGANFPDNLKLNQLAKAMGYGDWFALVHAIRQFRGK